MPAPYFKGTDEPSNHDRAVYEVTVQGPNCPSILGTACARLIANYEVRRIIERVPSGREPYMNTAPWNLLATRAAITGSLMAIGLSVAKNTCRPECRQNAVEFLKSIQNGNPVLTADKFHHLLLVPAPKMLEAEIGNFQRRIAQLVIEHENFKLYGLTRDDFNDADHFFIQVSKELFNRQERKLAALG